MGEFYKREETEDGKVVWKCSLCDYTTDPTDPSDVDGLKSQRGKVMLHHNPDSETRCPKRDWTKPTPLEEGIYRRKSDPTEILKGILSKHPDIQNPQMEELLSWADLQGGLLPGEVSHLLSNMKNVSKQTANIIGQKYGIALEKAARGGEADIQMFLTGAGQRPPIQPGGVGMGITPPYQQPAPQQMYYQPVPQQAHYPQWPQTQQWGPPLQQYQPQAPPREAITTEDIRKMIKESTEEREKESRLDTMEKNMQSLTNAVQGLARVVQEGGGGAKDDVIHVTEPVRDTDGNILVDKNGAPITRTVTGPASRVVSIEDPTAKMLNQLTLFERIKGKELTTDDIRKIVEEKMPVGTEDAKIKELMDKMDKMKEEMSAKERQKMEDEIKEMKDDIRGMRSQGAGGEYKTDEMRVLGQSMGRLADIIEGKKPLETAARVLFPPPAEGVEPEARGALEKALEESGYVKEE